MLRALVEFLVVIIVGYVIRSVMSIITSALHPSNQKPQASSPTTSGPLRPTAPAPSELRKDPVCGTFVSTATALQKTTGGNTYYFCSPQCRDQFRG
ncbi:MAG: YHS domain-containing protein [Bryobacteraceae bacterium]